MTMRISRQTARWVAILLAALGGLTSAQDFFGAEPVSAVDKSLADPDIMIQGEYAGEIAGQKFGVQVIALGEGLFRGVFYPGGLPGDGWERKMKRFVAGGRAANGRVVMKNDPYGCVIQDKSLVLKDASGNELGKLPQVQRASPTLNARPPEGSIVLFDGKNASQWREGNAVLTEDGLLIPGANSRRFFESGRLHVEFMLPFEPKRRGTERGNSGVFVQGRYEVQVLDSFGLDGGNSDCGGIYAVAAPAVNMCFPPLSWQTYDIEFTAARWEGGRKMADARMTVYHNGKLIHDDIDIPRASSAAPIKETDDPGFLHLQEHGSPVRFRNIWFVESK